MVRAALLASRAVIAVTGPDARGFLQGLITSDVGRLAAGDACFAALLTPQGKILFDFVMLAQEDGFLLDCHSPQADALVKRLSLYRLRAQAAIGKRADLAVAAFREGETPEPGDGMLVFNDPRLLALGQRVIGPAEAVAALTEGADAGEAAFERHRMTLGVPEAGADFEPDTLFLLDANYDALGGVDYKKGCFIGQEVTSRMKRKGEVRRRTLVAAYDGAPPAKGAPVMAGESILGEILSAADGAALVLIRLDRLAAAREAGAGVTAEGRPLALSFPAWLEPA